MPTVSLWEEWDQPSEEVDISELCELDWEGRKTVVAAEHQVISTTPFTAVVRA